MRTPNSRGQIFSTDLVVASLVFIFILTFSIILSTQIANRVALVEERDARRLAAQTAANALLYSEGDPANWENLAGLDGVSAIGLVNGMNDINPRKLQRFVDLNATSYDEVRDLLGVGRYGLKVSVLQLQDRQSSAEFGLEPGANDKVTAVNRIAISDSNTVIVRLKLFED